MRFSVLLTAAASTLLLATADLGVARAQPAAPTGLEADAPASSPTESPAESLTESPAGRSTGSSSIFPVPGAPDPVPFTLLDRYFDAARRGDLRMLKLCVDKGVDAKAGDEVGRSALMLAVRDARSLDVVRHLRGMGLPIDQPDARGRTALGDAAGLGEFAILEYLLEQGAAVNHKDSQGQSPLYNAVLGGNLQSVARLLKAGADINARDRYGDTPLMGACNKGHEAIARLLVEQGADPSLKDQEGRTAADRGAEGSDYCRELGAAAQPAEPAQSLP